MHTCLCAVCYLWLKKGRRALRLSASWSNWHVNHLSVGGIWVRVCECVFLLVERSMTSLKRQHVTARALSSLPSCSDASHGKTVELLSAERETDSQLFEPIAWIRIQIKHFSMRVVMRSCVCVFCQWPPPISLLTWLSLFSSVDVWMFSLLSPSPTQYPWRLQGKVEESHTLATQSTPVNHGSMTSQRRMRGHEGRKYNLCQSAERQTWHEKLEREMVKKVRIKWKNKSSSALHLKPSPRLDWERVSGSAQVSLSLQCKEISRTAGGWQKLGVD